MRKHILIIKHGSLGDVVRTSYFAGAVRDRYGEHLRLSWMTSSSALPLLHFNPHIDDIWTDFSATQDLCFDHLYSFDDEQDLIERVSRISCKAITGAVLTPDGQRTYTEDASEWFDMGLLSRFGKEKADELKKINKRTHAEIFSRILGIKKTTPEFYGIRSLEQKAASLLQCSGKVVGINPYAGERWPSKELLPEELYSLAKKLLSHHSLIGPDGRLVLLGAGNGHFRNQQLATILNDTRVVVPDTNDSVLHFAAVIHQLDYLITSDSLALHLGIGQHIPFLAFFTATSAVEIDGFGLGCKIISTAEDYCSYRNDADNQSITAERIISAMKKHQSRLFYFSDSKLLADHSRKLEVPQHMMAHVSMNRAAER